jgi:[NiFe] hydrogenase assembly HybE family chaperone
MSHADLLQTRMATLVAHYRHVAATRMAGVPVLHAGLRVQAVDMAPDPDAPQQLTGVLITPWFMNLLRLPLQPLDAARAAATDWLPVGQRGTRSVGGTALDFLGCDEPPLGVFEASSLFSPMFQFADQQAAVATAQEVLRLLRSPVPQPAPVNATPTPAQPAGAAAAPVPSRRGFLFGRGAAPGAR